MGPEHLQKSQLLLRIISIILLSGLETCARLIPIIDLRTWSFGRCRLCPLSSAIVILQLLVFRYGSLQIYREFEVDPLWIGKCYLSFGKLRLVIIECRSRMDCSRRLKITKGFEEYLENFFLINFHLQPNSLRHELCFKN